MPVHGSVGRYVACGVAAEECGLDFDGAGLHSIKQTDRQVTDGQNPQGDCHHCARCGGIGGGGPHFEYLWDVPVEKVDLTFDKPFMYLIRDKETGEIWFVGTVYEPTENKE